MARRKVYRAYERRIMTKKNELMRDVHLGGDQGPEIFEVAARQPTASQLAVADERLERLGKGLPAAYRKILDLLHQGHTHKAIALRFGISEKKITRFLQRLVKRHGIS